MVEEAVACVTEVVFDPGDGIDGLLATDGAGLLRT